MWAELQTTVKTINTYIQRTPAARGRSLARWAWLVLPRQPRAPLRGRWLIYNAGSRRRPRVSRPHPTCASALGAPSDWEIRARLPAGPATRRAPAELHPLHYPLHPGAVGRETGVDARPVALRAALAPANDSRQQPGAVHLAHQGAARVALWGEERLGTHKGQAGGRPRRDTPSRPT